MFFYAIIKGKISSAALWNVISRDDLNLNESEDSTVVYGDISPYALGWVLDRCSWFGEVTTNIPANKLEPYDPSSDKGA